MKDFTQVVESISREDSRYQPQVYYFVRHALDFTIKQIRKRTGRKVEQGNHVSGAELLEGIREYALKQYGPLTYMLLHEWGVRKCDDFGNIVFNLVDYGVLGKTEKDSKDDFAGVYDFRKAFLKPFQPERRPDKEKRNDRAS